MTGTNLTTMLFVPASRPERIAKALASGASAVIVDLEDAVSADDKTSARQALDEFLQSHQGAGIYIRVNGPGTVWIDEDLALCARHDKVVGVLLPKAESAGDVALAAATGKAVIPLVESAAALVELDEIARAPGVERLTYGGLDLSDDLGVKVGTGGGERILDQCRYQIVVSSRAAGLLPPIETVFPAFDDSAAVTARARRANEMGFAGMLCIHPKQVAPAMEGFAPDPAQVAWARKVMEGADTTTGAFKVDGQMVDAPVIAMARKILGRVPS